MVVTERVYNSKNFCVDYLLLPGAVIKRQTSAVAKKYVVNI